MSWLSELTGGIFLLLCCCTGWGSTEEGASRHAFTVANCFSAQWQNLALALRFHCVGGWRATKHESDSRVSACQVFSVASVWPLSRGLYLVIECLYWGEVLHDLICNSCLSVAHLISGLLSMKPLPSRTGPCKTHCRCSLKLLLHHNLLCTTWLSNILIQN